MAKRKERQFKDLDIAREYARRTGGFVHNTGDFYGYTSPKMKRGHLLVR